MIRLSASVFLILLLQILAYGQSAKDTKRWHFGAFTGAQFTIYTPKDPDMKMVTGLLAGADIVYDLQNSRKGWSVHLQPNFTASRNTSKSGTYGSEYYFEFKWRTQSVNLPLLVRYTITGGKLRPFTEIGANWAVWNHWSVGGSGLSCRDGGCYPLVSERTGAKFEGNRLSALAGAGVQVDIGKVTVPVTARVLQNLKKRESTYDPVSGTVYTAPRVWLIQVSAGIAF